MMLIHQHPVQENYVKLQRDAEANVVLLQAVREQLTVRDGELAQSQQELAEQKGRCSSMEVSMNAEMASRERTERELRTAYMQRDAIQGQLDRYGIPMYLTRPTVRHVVAAKAAIKVSAISRYIMQMSPFKRHAAHWSSPLLLSCVVYAEAGL